MGLAKLTLANMACQLRDIKGTHEHDKGEDMLIEFDTNAWLIGLAVLFLLLWLARRRGGWFLLFFAVFWVYLLVMASVTLFPIPVIPMADRVGLWQQINLRWQFSGLNLLPLYFGNCWELARLCAMGIWENILMTLPFGFGICFLARLRARDFLWLALMPGLVIEISQLLFGFAIGVQYRTVDVNDVLFNSLGVWLGFAIFKVLAWAILALVHRMGFAQRGVWAYLETMSAS